MMMNRQVQHLCIRRNTYGEAGFSLVEFLISSAILVVIGASVFSAITDVGRTASYQTEVQTVLQNTRVGMDTIARRIKQAGNNPLAATFEGITIGGAHQVQIRSDLTGSAPGQPDKGDPDGRIEVRVSLEPGALVVQLRDFARRIDVETVRSRSLDDIRPGGLGVHPQDRRTVHRSVCRSSHP